MLVLSALALIAFLALAVLTLVRSEDRASRTVADVAELRTLQGLPEKLVISQIRTATKDLLKFENGFTWTSQPGMIRVFGTDVQAGSPRAQVAEFYKLYSSDVMEVKRPDWNPLEEAQAMQGWQNAPSLWTDLNEPVVVRERREQYTPGSGSDSRLVYPIIDPRAVDSGVEGFDINGQGPGSTKTNPLPMPVRWLYVLADGQVVAPSSGGEGGKVTTLPGASESNPVVGRVAFWTDDESCKLNLNVASSPAPWDRPVTTSKPDVAHATAIPARGESYREPAHPAFTSLGPVLRRFGQQAGAAGTQSILREPGDPMQAGQNWADSVRNVHELLPLTPRWDVSAYEGSRAGTQFPVNEVQGKRQRWLTNVDEFFFAAEADNGNDRSRSRNGANRSLGVTQEDIELSRFFLTTHSRAPETNPFGWPKISLWPVSQETAARHQVDRKMTLASSLNTGGVPAPYYLQRAANWESEADPGSSQSATQDMAIERNQQLFNYLQVMTDNLLPGVGGAFVDKYGVASRNQIMTSMFDLLRWGVNPMSPYQQRLDEDLTAEYSYLAPAAGRSDNPNGVGSYTSVPLRLSVDDDAGEVVEEAGSLQWAVKGMGRFPTLTEVAIVLMPVEVERLNDDPKNEDAEPEWADKTTKVQAFVVVEPFNVSPGVTPASAAYRLRISGLDSLTLAGEPLGFRPDSDASPLVTRIACSPQVAGLSGEHAPYAGMLSQFMASDGSPKILPAGGAVDEDLHYVFAGGIIELPASAEPSSVGQTLEFNGGSLRLRLYDDASDLNADGALVQALDVEFPRIDKLQIPMVWMNDAKAIEVLGDDKTDARFKLRFSTDPEEPTRLPFIRRGDVVRSVEAAIAPVAGAGGDVRLLAARGEVPPKDVSGAPLPEPGVIFFKVREGPRDEDDEYQNGRTIIQGAPAPSLDWAFQVHSLRDGGYMMEGQPGFDPTGNAPRLTLDGAGFLAARDGGGGQVNLLQHGPAAVPSVPFGGAAMNFDNRPGDFDNGPGIIEDGPYINMPELGNALTQESAGSTTGGYFQRGGSFYEDDGITFSPWRQMGSAVGFGSLPSAVFGDAAQTVPRAWTTLLFCPHPPSRLTVEDEEPAYETSATPTAKKDHFGFGTPRDHLWLEFFWMPAVEPSGLSQGFATEGKVNMNYQILPFSWINRATAMHGALEGVRVTAIPSTAVMEAAATDHYKTYANNTGSPLSFRYAVDARQTLRQFEERFARGEVFVTASEICDQFLVPRRMDGHTYESGTVRPANPEQAAPTYTGVMEWWEGASAGDPTDGFEATGDNTREAPYAQLYPRLCTRSNVFKVHYRVQVLQKAASTKPTIWDEQKDRIAADYRGEATIERYLDPARTDIEDFATSPTTDRNLDDYYDYRITGRRQFVP